MDPRLYLVLLIIKSTFTLTQKSKRFFYEWTDWSEWSNCTRLPQADDDDSEICRGYQRKERRCLDYTQLLNNTDSIDEMNRLISNHRFLKGGLIDSEYATQLLNNFKHRFDKKQVPIAEPAHCKYIDIEESTQYKFCQVDCPPKIDPKPSEILLIEQLLRTTRTQLVGQKGAQLILGCIEPRLTMNDVPATQWIHNGRLVNDKGYRLELRNLSHAHSGVYVCFKQTKRELILLDKFVLVVWDGDLTRQRGESIELPCYGWMLKSIYYGASLYKVWYKNGRVISNVSLDWPATTSLESRHVNSMYIPKVSTLHSGVYNCVIVDMSTHRNWSLYAVRLVIEDNKTARKSLIDWLLNDSNRFYLKGLCLASATLVTFNFLYNIFNQLRVLQRN